MYKIVPEFQSARKVLKMLFCFLENIWNVVARDHNGEKWKNQILCFAKKELQKSWENTFSFDISNNDLLTYLQCNFVACPFAGKRLEAVF